MSTATLVQARPVGESVAAHRTRRPSRRPFRATVLVVLIGALLMGVVGVRIWHKPPIYLASVNVLFLSPDELNSSFSYIDTGAGVIATAGIVAKMVQPTSPYGQMSTPTVTLADEGVRNGWSVTLPNDGGQWTSNYDQGLLQVQVVGGDESHVATKLQALTGQINADLSTLQRQVPKADRIRTALSPTIAQTVTLTGSRTKAEGATLLLGVLLTATGVAYVRRRLRRSEAGSASTS